MIVTYMPSNLVFNFLVPYKESNIKYKNKFDAFAINDSMRVVMLLSFKQANNDLFVKKTRNHIRLSTISESI